MGAMSAKTVLIMGGGLAGLSAARHLLEAGYEVTLVEKRPFLGGRAFSFYDAQAECEVDNGQHVFMGCCSYYLQFLTALGVIDQTLLQRKLRAEVVRDGKLGVLSSSPLLGPLHMVPSFLMYPHLKLRDKLLVLYGLVRVRLADRHKNGRRLDHQPFYEWLKGHHQTEEAISNFWNLVILPTLNDDVRSVSSDMALMVVQEGLLGKPSDAAIGLSRVGLSSLTGEPARRFLEERGARLVLGRSVRSLKVEARRVEGVRLSDGQVLQADAYVSALPFDILLKVLPDDLRREPFFAGLAQLTSSPIVGIHLWYDKPVMEQDFVACLDSPAQWVFNKSLIQRDGGAAGQYICISVSGAWDYVNAPKSELVDLFCREIRRLFPMSRTAHLLRSVVVKQREATFRCLPNTRQHRPQQVTPTANLFLAGEWTDTGWPSTMEGAVRSGVFAAEALASRIR